MRLKIDTTGVKFRVRGMPQAKAVSQKDARQRQTPDGKPVWTVRLDAIDDQAQTGETIWVEVAGDEPRLTFDDYAQVHGLVFAPWVGNDGKLRRAFRADAVTAIADARKANAA